MSYIVIKVYSFECDYPGCRVTNMEIVPDQRHQQPLLRAAEHELRTSERWTVKAGRHYCPKHTEPEAERLAPEDRKD